MKKIRYERPGLVDLSGDLPTGRAAECYTGYSAARFGDCGGGSCVSNAWCGVGSSTGYCYSGSATCSRTTTGCKSCCYDGSAPDQNYGCNCWEGSSAALDCATGLSAVTFCDTGSGAGNLQCLAPSNCASGPYG